MLNLSLAPAVFCLDVQFILDFMFMMLFISSPAGWLLDIAKLQLGDNIGEGEFGGKNGFTSLIKRFSPKNPE